MSWDKRLALEPLQATDMENLLQGAGDSLPDQPLNKKPVTKEERQEFESV